MENLEESTGEVINQSINNGSLKAVSIEKEIEPFLSDKVKAFWKNIYTETGIDEDGKLHACFIKCNDESFDDKPNPFKIEWLAKMINRVANEGLIEAGSLGLPIYIKLHRFNASDPNKFLLCYFPMTRIKNEKLIADNNKTFVREGEMY